ncbi:hypothetical protein ACFDTO_35540 [Microbacteriaceae bacterium 4G12]
MTNGIFISIRPKYCNLIKKRIKINEFRSYKPKQDIQTFWIYESAPTSALKYIAEVADPVEYPEKLEIKGDGDDRFNSGKTKYKFAFKIVHLYELETPLTLHNLKSEFNFSPPQSFAYINTYPKLIEFVRNEIKLNRIF